MAAESRFAVVLDDYLSSLLHKSTKKSTKYGMKIFNGRNAQNKFELLKCYRKFDSFCNRLLFLSSFRQTKITIFCRMVFKPNKV